MKTRIPLPAFLPAAVAAAEREVARLYRSYLDVYLDGLNAERMTRDVAPVAERLRERLKSATNSLARARETLGLKPLADPGRPRVRIEKGRCRTDAGLAFYFPQTNWLFWPEQERLLGRAGVAVVVLALAVGACGKSSTVKPLTATTGVTSTTAAPAATTTTSAPTTTEAAGISSYKDVQPAVIQIEARGTFRDPEVGYANGSGRGSGFIISPDGLAVTNNHVVTGAATLEIFIGGDTTHSYNATVLGVSECNDLALIKINDPDPLRHQVADPTGGRGGARGLPHRHAQA